MSIHYDLQILRSKLIAMGRLTQRTVDYSIKAMQLGRPELCCVVQSSTSEMTAIRCWIESHGRALLEAGISTNADLRFVCAALRIATALEAAHHAAIKIAQQSEVRFAAGWIPVSAELQDAGQFVNSLLRLCILSLLQKDERHAKTVLHSDGTGQSLDLAVYLTHGHLTEQAREQVRFELSIIRCLDGIAGQAREIADSIIACLEKQGRGYVASRSVVHKSAHLGARFAGDACRVSVADSDSSCKELIPRSAIPLRQEPRLNPHDDRGIPSQVVGEGVATEDFTRARLMGLQQRVCELLVKNQQLRMALIAEKAGGHYDQLC